MFPVSGFSDEKNRRGSGTAFRRLCRETAAAMRSVAVHFERFPATVPGKALPVSWSVSPFQMPGVLKLSLWSRVRKGHVVFVKITAFCTRPATFPHFHAMFVILVLRLWSWPLLLVFFFFQSFFFCFVLEGWLVSLTHICGEMTYSTKMSPAGRNNMLKKRGERVQREDRRPSGGTVGFQSCPVWSLIRIVITRQRFRRVYTSHVYPGAERVHAYLRGLLAHVITSEREDFAS